MKRIITLTAAIAISALMLFAGPERIRTSSFDSMDISWLYHVELSISPSCDVQVDAPDFVKPYLDVKVKGGCLQLGYKEMPRDIKRKMETGKYEIIAHVTAPEMKSIEMSGAAKLNVKGQIETPEFTLGLSGAAKATGLSVNCRQATIDCSGAAKTEIEGTLGNVRATVSGASSASINADTEYLHAEVSGASKLVTTGSNGNVRMSLSGASGARMEGTMDSLKLVGTGASKFHGSNIPCTSADINLSGASKAEVAVNGEMNVNLSGASTCHYSAGDRFQLKKIDMSRGASLKQL